MEKKSILLALLFLTAGSLLAQDKLVRVNEKAFEKIAESMNKDQSNPYLSTWAKDVFRSYYESNSVDFSEKDFKNAKDSIEYYRKRYNALLKKENKDNSKEKLTKLTKEVDSLKKVIKNKDTEYKKFQKNSELLSDKETQIRNKDSLILEKEREIAEIKKTQIEQEEQLNQLRNDTVILAQHNNKLDEELAGSKNDLSEIKNHVKEQDSLISMLNDTVGLLKKEIDDFEKRIETYEAAFKATKEAIYGIYNASKELSLLDMDIEKLAEAQRAWDGMKALLQSANPLLAEELKGKVDEINQWKEAIIPMREAKEYLKGKYDNENRKKQIAEIAKLELIGDKEQELKDIQDALNDQEKIKKNYDTTLLNLKDFGCLPNKEQMEEAYAMVQRMKGYVSMYYHPSCYSTYDSAIKIIENELTKEAPSDTINNPEKYRNFIKELQNTF